MTEKNEIISHIGWEKSCNRIFFTFKTEFTGVWYLEKVNLGAPVLFGQSADF